MLIKKDDIIRKLKLFMTQIDKMKFKICAVKKMFSTDILPWSWFASNYGCSC